MIEEQASLCPIGERIDYAVIVTPELCPFRPGHQARQGRHSRLLRKAPDRDRRPGRRACRGRRGKEGALRHRPYVPGPLVELVRTMAGHQRRAGCKVRWVDAYYLQGWLATKLEDENQMQASWRTDPKKAGASCCGGDIGTHAFMQARFVTGLEITSVRGHGRDLPPRPAARRPLHHILRTVKRRAGNDPRHANRHRPQKRPGYRGQLRTRHADPGGRKTPECVKICLPGEPDRIYWRGEVNGDDTFLKERSRGV